MPMVTYPLNNIEYTAEDAELFHSTRTSGVYATNSFNFSVTGADNTVVIGTGIAWIKNGEFSGKVVAQKESVSLDLGLPDPIYPRIDAVIIQFDSNKNASEIVVKKGTAASNPVAPNVVRTAYVYELHLYHVRRDAGALIISTNCITDLRTNDNYCGLMSDSVTQAVDTTLTKKGVAADSFSVGNRISQITAKDVGALPATGGTINGGLNVGGKVYIGTDGEGGNIQFRPPNGLGMNFWEMDAINGNARFFGQKSDGSYVNSLILNMDGSVSTGNPTQTIANLGAAPADIYKYFPLSATSGSYGRKITDALNVNLGDPLADENRPGWVYLTETTQLPDGFNHGIREVYYYGSEWITVKLTGWGGSFLGSCVVYNTYRGGSIGWTGWEWENPPVEVGVEYCTTERWSGKPVYTKRIDFLELPSNSEKRVAHTTSGKVVLGVRMGMGNYTPLTVGDGASVIGVSATEVYVRTTTTFNQTATAQIWYTKA